MTMMADRLILKSCANSSHPYRLFEIDVDQAMCIGNRKVLLDTGCRPSHCAGCAGAAPRIFIAKARRPPASRTRRL